MVKVLAVIPARGGSKGITRKNIKKMGNYPLIAYSIAAAQQAQVKLRTIVSTDDAEIAEIAQKYGAEVPFLRPAEYAQDHTPDLPVFEHAIKWLQENESYRPDIVIQLRPTSPFRPINLVDRAVQILLDHPEASSVRGVIPSQQNPYKMWKVDSDGRMEPLLKTKFSEPYNMPRQKLPKTFWQTGHIDVVRVETILNGSMSGESIFSCVIDPAFSVDLDSLEDWQRAEWKLNLLKNQISLPDRGRKLENLRPNLLVLDFDGVLTDDRVYVNQHGEESVAAHRGDGMGISLLKKNGIEVVILSTEKNPVVSARGKKLNVPVFQGITDKGSAIQQIMNERDMDPNEVIFVGNDINDLVCFPLVGLAVAVADAHPDLIREADLVLRKKGGQGAVRELCDQILENQDLDSRN
jgi:N-acylneuraminate cytidylyltransferase